MSVVRLIASDELRLMRRNAVALLAIAMVLILSIIAAYTSTTHQQASDALRSRFQAQANAEFANQPNRHPHRMVHYGHFAFRPLGALAAFDSGVDPFTGNMIYLEGHRQNSANFGDVRQSSLLVRFGQLTPSFVLQALAPLVLIFIGFGAVSRERERGTLRQVFAHGVTARRFLHGKLAALVFVSGLSLLPAVLAILYLIAAEAAPLLPAALLIGGYALYLLIWAGLIVLVSAISKQGRTSLLLLVGLWAVTVILLPRIAPDIALAANPLPTRLENDIAIQRDLRAMGDSHNPDDPYFAAFKARVLKQYGVTRVEDLPVNYRGLLAVEGEKLTSTLFDEYARRSFATQAAQSRVMDGFALLSPNIALRRTSMAAAGTDLDGHKRFLDQAEAYRFALVQRLNQLQADAVSAEDDANKNNDSVVAERRRISAKNWQAMPQFAFQPQSTSEKVRAALPGLGLLAGWLLVIALAFPFAARRLAKAGQ
jgi:ABC-2 type transport system permease protein